jgi:hypothetical protein
MRYNLSLFVVLLLFVNYKTFAQSKLSANGLGNTYELINSVLAPNYNVVEAPDLCASHPQFGRHIAQVWDSALGKYVFEFYIHVPTTFPVGVNTADNDRCLSFDRQRIEIKTYDQSPDSLIGIQKELVTYKWKFKIPNGFQPSTSFTHLHQVKAVGGDDDMPLFTLTARKANPNRLELIYVADSSAVNNRLGTINLSALLNTWVEVTETIKVGVNGTFSINVKRVSDGLVLLNYTNNNIKTIRPSNSFIRPKWGIYRSLNNVSDLRDESIRFDDFYIEEIVPKVVIYSSTNSVCPNQPITFTAQAFQAGNNISYQWKKNGINIGTNAPTIIVNNLQNRDTFFCILTSLDTTIFPNSVLSNRIVVTVKNNNLINIDTSVCSNSLPFNWMGQAFANATPMQVILQNSVGCDSIINLKVNLLNNPPQVQGANSICVGSNTQLTANVIGGVWSSIAGRAVVNSTGLVTANNVGVAFIQYTINDGSCKGVAQKIININSLPAIPSIMYAHGNVLGFIGNSGFCRNASFGLQGIPSNGVWKKTGGISVTPESTPSTQAIIHTNNILGNASVTYTVTNNNGCKNSKSILSQIVNCGAKNQSNVQKIEYEFSYQVYPNPVKDFVHIYAKNVTDAAKFSLTSIEGKLLYNSSLSVGVNTIPVSNLSKGTYILVIETAKKTYSDKILLK